MRHGLYPDVEVAQPHERVADFDYGSHLALATQDLHQ